MTPFFITDPFPIIYLHFQSFCEPQNALNPYSIRIWDYRTSYTINPFSYRVEEWINFEIILVCEIPKVKTGFLFVFDF